MGTFYNSNIVTDGLVLCLDAANPRSYPKSGTIWNDLSGNNNHGTLVNGPTFSSSNGGSIVFDGSNDSVNISLNTSISVSSSASSSSLYQWTVMAFYKSNNILTDINSSNPRHTIFAFNDSTFTNNGWYYLDLELWNDSYVFFNGNGTSSPQGAYVDSSRGSNNTGSFNLATLTINGNTISVYHNNALFRSTRNSTASMSSQYIKLGHRGIDNLLSGSIAAFYVYNQVLSSSEIIQNFNATRGRYGI